MQMREHLRANINLLFLPSSGLCKTTFPEIIKALPFPGRPRVLILGNRTIVVHQLVMKCKLCVS